MDKYPALLIETNLLTARLGLTGLLDALEYISDHFEEYDGTAIGRQFRLFQWELSKML